MSELHLETLSVAHLQPVNLRVRGGELVCISGESGSGKSLLLRCIADIIPHAGSIYLDGQAETSMSGPDWRKKVGLLPAESQWWDDRVGSHFQLVDIELFSSLGFEKEVMDWSVSRCSTGEKQRLALLRLLSGSPDCLLLDEPTGSLDPQNTKKVEELVQKLCREQGIPVLWVSHSAEQIKRIADRHFIMRNGSLTEDD